MWIGSSSSWSMLACLFVCLGLRRKKFLFDFDCMRGGSSLTWLFSSTKPSMSIILLWLMLKIFLFLLVKFVLLLRLLLLLLLLLLVGLELVSVCLKLFTLFILIILIGNSLPLLPSGQGSLVDLCSPFVASTSRLAVVLSSGGFCACGFLWWVFRDLSNI